MPWCPNCKNEYVDGVEYCTDCNCKLVDELQETQGENVIFGEKDFIEELNAFIEYNGLPRGKILPIDDSENSFELYVKKDFVANTKKIIRVFLQEKSLTELEEQEEKIEKNAFGATLKPYQDKKERAEEVKSSAYTLTIIGILGILFLILLELDVFPLNFSVFTKHMTTVVMGIFFFLFTIMGLHSFSSLKKIKEQSLHESDLINAMKQWCSINLTKESIDSAIFQNDEEYQNEIKYFMRSEEMKKNISNQFLNLEDGFLDKFIEEEYMELYSDEN